MRGSSILVVFIPLLFAIPDAHAGDREVQERAAKKACLTGDASKGTEILADLYIDTSEPVYIFNQGRCFEQNSRYVEAIGRFREYLRKATNASEAEKIDVQKHIADCEVLLARTGAGAGSAPAADPLPAAAVAPQPQPPPPVVTTQSEPVVSIQQAPDTEPSMAGSGLRTVGVVTGAVGGAALIAAVALNLKANGMIDDLRSHYNKDTDSSSKTYKTLSEVGYGVGAAFVAGGVVLYYLGWTAGDRTKVALLPSFASGTAGAILEGAF
jgi:hypothetical protein